MAEPIDKDARGPVNLRIKFRSESLQQFIERYGVDVSRGGIFIRTREPLPVGTRLKLDFQLVDTAPLFQGDGTVVWIREHDASRAGVTPGMGVRFDRLTPESQTTLDTILEEKIRLQQSGVAPGSIAKAGAGMAVRRPSGAFATLESQGGRSAAPPPLPFEVKLDTPIAPPVGAAPLAVMPTGAARSGQVTGGGSSSIFTRPRTTSGMRTVPVPSALFEPPTAADIDKALSALEEKGGGPPALPVAPTVVHRGESRPVGDDDPTKVFDAGAAQEFSAHDAITGPAAVLPETGVPVSAGADGDLTQPRVVDPVSGEVSAETVLDIQDTTAEFGKKPPTKANGKVGKKAEAPPPVPGAAAKPAAPLDAPLSSLVDSGKAPPVTPPAAAHGTAASVPIPKKITTDRPAATESGRFRSDARYKRKRGKGLYYALGFILACGGIGAGGWYYKQERARRAAEQAAAAAAAAPPLAAGQTITTPPSPPTGTEVAPPAGSGGAAAGPGEAAGPSEAPGKATPKPEGAVAKTETAKPDKTGGSPEKSAKGSEKAEKSPRRKDRGAGSATETAAVPSATPAEVAKPPAETAKPETAKPAEAAKPADGDKADKPAEAAKPAETAKPAEAAKPAETAKPAEAAVAPAAPPSLKITSTPAGAEVVIDGVPVGTTPFSSKEVSADGTHAITLRKEGYESHERMISASDWSRGKGGVQSLKVSVKLKKTGGEPPKPPAEAGEKKPEVEILTPSEP
jgi:uncharacterized protein (TIGR02266 family)